MTDTPTTILRRLLLLVVVTLAAAAAVVPAQAASVNCGRQVINDWYDNGRVDKIYPISCYTKAIRLLPEDAIAYSTAKEDILRALQYAKQNKPDPGDTTGIPTTGSNSTSTTQTSTGKGKPKPTTSTTTDTESGTGTDTGDGGTEAAGPGDDSGGASSVPVPVLVLGGLALLLLAAGTAGFVTRRLQARRGDGGGDPPLA